MNHLNPNNRPHDLDEQERMIVRALVRDPRLSDNQIGKLTGVPTPTVRRKRKRLEAAGFHPFMPDQFSAVNTDGYTLAIGGIRIQVPENEVADATEFLAAPAE